MPDFDWKTNFCEVSTIGKVVFFSCSLFISSYTIMLSALSSQLTSAQSTPVLPEDVQFFSFHDSDFELLLDQSSKSSDEFSIKSDEHEMCCAQIIPPSLILPTSVPSLLSITKSDADTSAGPVLSSTEELQTCPQFSKYEVSTKSYEREKAKADRSLLRAVRNGDCGMCEELLKGSGTEWVAANANLKTTLNDTLLHIVSRSGNSRICALLLTRGLSPELKSQNDDGETALHLACKAGHIDIVRLLVKAGADFAVADSEGNTPLHCAALARHFEVAKYLRLSGADGKIRNKQGRTADECQAIRSLSDLRRTLQVPMYSSIPRVSGKPKPRQSLELSLGDFELLSQLGKGSFGEVYLARKIATGQRVALKVMKKEMILSQKMTKYVFTERDVLRRVKHPFVIGFRAAFQTSDNLFLVLDYCPGGDLAAYLSREKRFSEYKARMYICEVLLALEELHRNDIIYRDLKPDNVVLDAQGHAVLTDFGLAKEGVADNYAARSFCGSMGYLAPEMLRRQGHGKAVDWYMLGVLLYELMTGVLPYFSRDKQMLFRNIAHGPLSFPDYLSPDARDLLKSVFSNQLLNRDPDLRLGSGTRGVDEIKEHPFFKGVQWTQVLKRGLKPPAPGNPEMFTKPLGGERLKRGNDAERYMPGWSLGPDTE